MMKNIEFPKDFLWGASTSSFQVEGGATEGGKGLSVQEIGAPNPGRTDFSVAADFYHHYKEDIALMKEMGFKAYRMSIAWPRILPNGDDDQPNPEGVAFYKAVFAECKKHGIEPVVTMFHFDLPQALKLKYGGWDNREMIDVYVRYCELLMELYQDDVRYWLTFNEQNMLIFFGAFDMTGDGKTARPLKTMYTEAHNQLLAQAKVMKICHDTYPTMKIAPAPNVTCTYPSDSDPINVIAARNYGELRNYFYLDALCKGRYPQSALNYLAENDALPVIQEGDMAILKSANPDFIAFNYYGGDTVEYLDPSVKIDMEALKNMRTDDISFLASLMSKPGLGKSVENKQLEKTDYGMSIDPVGIRITARDLYDRYQLPLIITENGCGTSDTLSADNRVHDDYRIDYLKKHIEQLKLAIYEGVDLMGYCPWSAIDLVSTREGISKRYGLIYVNRDEFDLKDMRRIPKDSFYWYKQVIASNGENLEYNGSVNYE